MCVCMALLDTLQEPELFHRKKVELELVFRFGKPRYIRTPPLFFKYMVSFKGKLDLKINVKHKRTKPHLRVSAINIM